MDGRRNSRAPQRVVEHPHNQKVSRLLADCAGDKTIGIGPGSSHHKGFNL